MNKDFDLCAFFVLCGMGLSFHNIIDKIRSKDYYFIMPEIDRLQKSRNFPCLSALSPWQVVIYVKFFTKKRRNDLEDIILQDSTSAGLYAYYCLGKRWREGEGVIFERYNLETMRYYAWFKDDFTKEEAEEFERQLIAANINNGKEGIICLASYTVFIKKQRIKEIDQLLRGNHLYSDFFKKDIVVDEILSS